jgi:hypothetical protein
MKTGSAFQLKRVGGLTALVGTAMLALAVLTSQAAIAGGNPNFEGILSAAQPTGFMSSPDAYDASSGPVTVDFDVAVSNLTTSSQTVALNFSAHHILTYDGVDVSDGQPGQPGITFNGPAGTTQELMPGTQAFTDTWAPSGSLNLALTYAFAACGYYQIDVWAPVVGGAGSRARATLASGFIRVLGCEASPTPTPTVTPTATPTATPTPTSSPTGGVGGATATPTPVGGVQGITSPGTGAGGGLISLGVVLLIAGAGMLVVGVRGRRIDI